MNDGQLGWLRSNRTRLLDSQMPIDNILDELVAKHVFYTNHDDYQIISVQPTTSTKTRHLLDALPSKSPASFKVLSKPWRNFVRMWSNAARPCPSHPRHAWANSTNSFSAVYTSRKHAIMPAMAWLGATGEVRVETFFRDLVVVDREKLANCKSMTDRASSTAAEQRRREVDYARPARQRTIAFRSLFQSFTNFGARLCGLVLVVEKAEHAVLSHNSTPRGSCGRSSLCCFCGGCVTRGFKEQHRWNSSFKCCFRTVHKANGRRVCRGAFCSERARSPCFTGWCRQTHWARRRFCRPSSEGRSSECSTYPGHLSSLCSGKKVFQLIGVRCTFGAAGLRFWGASHYFHQQYLKRITQ